MDSQRVYFSQEVQVRLYYRVLFLLQPYYTANLSEEVRSAVRVTTDFLRGGVYKINSGQFPVLHAIIRTLGVCVYIDVINMQMSHWILFVHCKCSPNIYVDIIFCFMGTRSCCTPGQPKVLTWPTIFLRVVSEPRD